MCAETVDFSRDGTGNTNKNRAAEGAGFGAAASAGRESPAIRTGGNGDAIGKQGESAGGSTHAPEKKESEPTREQLSRMGPGAPSEKPLPPLQVLARAELAGKTTDRAESLTRLFSRENVATIEKLDANGKPNGLLDLKEEEKITTGNYLVTFKNGRKCGIYVPENKSGNPMSIMIASHGAIIPGWAVGAAQHPADFANKDLSVKEIAERNECVLLTPHFPLHPVREGDNPIYLPNVEAGLIDKKDYDAYTKLVQHDDIRFVLDMHKFALDTVKNITAENGCLVGHSYGGIEQLAAAADPSSAGLFPNILFIASTAAIKDGKPIIRGLAKGNGTNVMFIRPLSSPASLILVDVVSGYANAGNIGAATRLGQEALPILAEQLDKIKVDPKSKLGGALKFFGNSARKLDPGVAHIHLDPEHQSPSELVNLFVGLLGTGAKLESYEYKGPQNSQARTLSDFKPSEDKPVTYSPSDHNPKIHHRAEVEAMYKLTSSDGQKTFTVVNLPDGDHLMRNGGRIYYYDENGKLTDKYFNVQAAITHFMSANQQQRGPIVSENMPPMHGPES